MLEAAGAEVERPKGSASFALADADGFIPLEGIIDRDAELKRQKKEQEKLRNVIAGQREKAVRRKIPEPCPRRGGEAGPGESRRAAKTASEHRRDHPPAERGLIKERGGDPVSTAELSENPLLVTDGLPRFDRIEPEHVVPAVQKCWPTRRPGSSRSKKSSADLGRGGRRAR